MVGLPYETDTRSGRRGPVVVGRLRDEPQLQLRVLGVADATARLQPRWTLGHKHPDEHERHGGGYQCDGRCLRVVEQRAGQINEQHAKGHVYHGPGGVPRREALSAVDAGRHRN